MATSALKPADRQMQDAEGKDVMTVRSGEAALITAHNCLNPSPLRDDSFLRLHGGSKRPGDALRRVRP
jgi:hypothetical protein